MADPRFFTNKGPFSLYRIAEAVDAQLADPQSGSREVAGVAPLANADSRNLSFLENSYYTQAFQETNAGACFVTPDMQALAPPHTACLLTEAPYRAYARAVALFHPETGAAAGQADSAIVEPTATIARDAAISPGAIVQAGAEIGQRVWIEAGAIIGPGVIIGDGTRVDAGASVTCALIGRDCHIYPGARIGQDGFGFAPGEDGHLKVPQVGRVVIEDDVWVGGNAAIDRGANRDTVIRQGARLDNLVHVGHNCEIGRYAVLCGQVGLAGSVAIGAYAMLGGQAGVAPHLTVGQGAQVAAQAGVTKDVPAGETVYGFPATPAKQFWRQMATLRKMTKTKSG